MIPTECWSECLTEHLTQLVLDGSGRPRTRGELLELLAARDLDRAVPNCGGSGLVDLMTTRPVTTSVGLV